MPNPSSSDYPKLKKLGRKQIHAFLKDREQYLLRVKDAIASGHNLPIVPLIFSVDHDLLLSLFQFKCFPGANEFSQVTDEILMTYLKSKDEVKLEAVSLEDLEVAVKSSVKINVHEPDAELRILALFTDYQTLLRTKKWERLVEDNPKLSVRHITGLLKPAALNSNIEKDLALGIIDLRNRWLPFFEHDVKRAVTCEEYIR